MNRQADHERVSEITFIFDALNEETFEVKNLQTLQEFVLKNPRMSQKVRLQFAQVYTTGNNGGAFNVFGVPCTSGKAVSEDTNVVSDKQKEFEDKIFRLKCTDSYITN